MATISDDATTASPISTHRHGDVLVILSNSPPVNALGAAVREGLVAGIRQAEGDDAIKAVVIACEGQTFFAGADVSEFGTPKAFQEPMLPNVVDIIENCPKPVVAAELYSLPFRDARHAGPWDRREPAQPHGDDPRAAGREQGASRNARR